jgi:L-threonylcarbamoyladenylate synthase
MISNSLDQAIECLKNDDVVAIPTETVYGLAAQINSPRAIAKIFEIKKRPFFDPLIVHVSSKKMAETLTTDWSPLANFLAEHFWPGPLTMVLPKSEIVSSMITSGLPSVGIRMPKHSLALSLMDRLGVPLAAPSANLFGKTSPTRAEHVEVEFKSEKLLVLDGGDCEVGVESTVLLIKRSGEKYDLAILRAGDVTQSTLDKSLRGARFDFQFVQVTDKKESPGHMKHHYMPAIPLLLTSIDLSENEIIQQSQKLLQTKPKKIRELILSVDARIAARDLYAKLRELAEIPGTDLLYFRLKPEHQSESWQAIMDRLTKAASFTLK